MKIPRSWAFVAEGCSYLGLGLGCGLLVVCCAAAVAILKWAASGFPGLPS
jgi:hypothetical protein